MGCAAGSLDDVCHALVSVVGCMLGYSSCLVVWIPLFLDPSDGAFGRFDLAALCGCRTLKFLFVCLVLSKKEWKLTLNLGGNSQVRARSLG